MPSTENVFLSPALRCFAWSSLLFCLTHNLFLSGVLRALQGLAAAMILASGSAALAQLYDGAQRTRAFSILGTVFGIGLAFGPLLIGFMIDAVGWRGVYALFALLSAGVLLIGLVSLPATEKRAADTRQPGPNPVYAGPDAVYCIAYGHSGPRFFLSPDHAGLAHRVGGGGCSWRLSYAAGG